MPGLWYTGICDDLYKKVALWNAAYWSGEVHSTRLFMNASGDLVNKTTKCAHRIPFRQQELEHLVRIASELRPDSQLLEELKKVQKLWKIGQAVKGNRYAHGYWGRYKLPSGLHRVITLAFYPEHAKEVMVLLSEAKMGKSIDVDTVINNKKAEGKDIFEQ